MKHKGYEIEPFDGGYIVNVTGDEIYCDTKEEAEQVIDEFLEEECDGLV